MFFENAFLFAVPEVERAWAPLAPPPTSLFDPTWRYKAVRSASIYGVLESGLENRDSGNSEFLVSKNMKDTKTIRVGVVLVLYRNFQKCVAFIDAILYSKSLAACHGQTKTDN